MARSVDINTQYREIEKSVNLTVMSASPTVEGCGACGEQVMVFYCHLFRERKVEALCKECAIKRAGGEEKVWVRTDRDVREHWAKGMRLKRGRAISKGGPVRVPRKSSVAAGEAE